MSTLPGGQMPVAVPAGGVTREQFEQAVRETARLLGASMQSGFDRNFLFTHLFNVLFNVLTRRGFLGGTREVPVAAEITQAEIDHIIVDACGRDAGACRDGWRTVYKLLDCGKLRRAAEPAEEPKPKTLPPMPLDQFAIMLRRCADRVVNEMMEEARR